MQATSTTLYDAQLFWDPYCTISSWHGVTSIVIGNCGFGFAPVRAELRDRAMLTMTRTEAIPYASTGNCQHRLCRNRSSSRGWRFE